MSWCWTLLGKGLLWTCCSLALGSGCQYQLEFVTHASEEQLLLWTPWLEILFMSTSTVL